MPPTRRGRDRELRRNERRRRRGINPGSTDTTLPEDVTPTPPGGTPGGGGGGGGGGGTPAPQPAPPAPSGTPSAPTGGNTRLSRLLRRVGNRLTGQQ